MALLSETLSRAGHWFFKWRSFLPLLLLPLAAVALRDYRYPWGSRFANEIWWLACAGLSAAGLIVRFATVGYSAPGTSGRNTAGQNAESLNTTGPYSVVRNPLYVANFIIVLGISLTLRSVWFTLVTVLFYVIFYERIILAEEEFLAGKFGGAYREWAARVPAFIPNLSLWTKPDERFSLWKAVRQEANGYVNIAVVYTALKVATDSFAATRIYINAIWAGWLAASVLLYAVVKTVSKAGAARADRRRFRGQA